MRGEGEMRCLALTFAAASLTAFTWTTLAGAGGPPLLPPNWHVHDAVTASQVNDQHKLVSFFPAILTGGNTTLYLQDPASCPNATDKAFLPSVDTSESDILRAGQCQTSAQVIHLRTVPVGTSGPEGWTMRAGPEAGYVTYYLITSR
jgi:hypothetical protein